MVRAITILFVLMTASVVQASTFCVKFMKKSCDQNSCKLDEVRGTCVLIGKHNENAVYLTVAHGTRGAQSVWVAFNGWQRARVVLEHYQGMEDISIIETSAVPDLPATLIACDPPKSGEVATAKGYPNWSPRTITRSGRVQQFRDVQGKVWRFTAPAQNGDSGGPVLNQDGRLLGITKGYDPRPGYQNATVYTDTEVINTCLRRAYGRAPSYCNPIVRVPQTQPIQPKPDSLIIDNSDEIAALEGQIERLRADIDKLNKTKIPVQIKRNGKVIADKQYNLGETIKLTFDAIEKDGK